MRGEGGREGGRTADEERRASRGDPAILRQLYDPELSLHINGIYIRLPESGKHFSRRQRDDRRRRRGNWDAPATRGRARTRARVFY